MTTFALTADFHGALPPPEAFAGADVILLAGDIAPYCDDSRVIGQMKWLNGPFRYWLEILKIPVIAVAGNHDMIFELNRDLVPKLPWTYLEDTFTEFQGFKIHGSPWQLPVRDENGRILNKWAFNLNEEELERKWSFIPEDTDILLLHGPPYGYGDLLSEGFRVGSVSLTERIKQIKPKLVVNGHLHDQFGQYFMGDIRIINASLRNDKYHIVNHPVFVNLS